MTHADIIARLTAATGPDRELDALIWAELDGRDVRVNAANKVMLAKSRRAPFDECSLGHFRDGPFVARSFMTLPLYTASVDACLAPIERVLPGWDWGVKSLGEDGSEGKLWKHGWHDDTVIRAFHALPVIALLLALFRALEAQEAV